MSGDASTVRLPVWWSVLGGVPRAFSAGRSSVFPGIRLAVTLVLVATTLQLMVAAIGPSYDDPMLADTGDWIQSLLGLTASVTLLWWPVIGVPLAVAALAAVPLRGVQMGDDFTLAAISTILIGVAGPWRHVLRLVAFWLLFFTLTPLRFLGEMPLASMIGNALGAYAVILAVAMLARGIRHGRQRAQARLADLAAENALIRSTERAELAGELRTVVLRSLDETSRALADADGTAAGLRRSLQISEASAREALSGLRLLLGVLRADQPTRRRSPWAGLAPVLAHPALCWGVGTLAVGLLGVSCVVPLSPNAQLMASSAATFVAILVGDRRLLIAAGAAAVVAGFVCVMVLSGEQQLMLLVTSVVTLALVAPVSMLVRQTLQSRVNVAVERRDLEDQREELRADERAELARDLHDTVAHQLSLSVLQIDAHGDSDDPATLAAVARAVDAATAAARTELADLVATSSAAPAPTLRETLEPLTRHLSAFGHHVVLDVDPGVHLTATTSTTLARVLTEATTNVLRYAPPSSTCHIRVRPQDGQLAVSVTSPLGGGRRRDLSTGHGLRGIRERIDLLGGRFQAGPSDGSWAVEAVLPA